MDKSKGSRSNLIHSAFPSQSLEPAQSAELMNAKKRPCDHQLEQATLGALILEKEALNEVIEVLKADSFDREAHQMIYNAIVGIFNRSEPVDAMTIVHELKKKGELEKAGGVSYIAQLSNNVTSSANVVHYARILQEYSIKRKLIGVSNEIQQKAYDDTTDVFDLLDKMENSLFEVSEENVRKNYVGMNDVVKEVFMELESLKDNQDGMTGVPSGFTGLDRVTSGWQPSDLIIIAARPAMGKTAFILSACRNASVGFQKATAIFSLEMSAAQLVKRLVSAEAELESEKLKKGNLSDAEWRRLVDKTGQLSSAPIYIDDTPALTVLELRAKCRRLKAQHDIQLIVIDYLQLMSAGDSKSKGNREQEIAFISRSLKQIAKELNVPVIALSQLSRAVETRGGDKRPQLSDLRESGSIEQDADMVMFLYRPEYYGLDEDEEGNSTKGMGEVIISKNRSGGLENVRLKFIGQYTKFTDWEESSFMHDDMMGNMDMGGFAGAPIPANMPSGEVSFDQMNALPPDLNLEEGFNEGNQDSNQPMTFPSKLNRNEDNNDENVPPPSNDPPF
ncbi:replicative DNA helicase [Flammeovirga yaeyamensis]|nr:replicative DNA helicase [Flammeovirga yaeyamensis]MBB3696391.1 replicative DNA helicase [Flammeovirga yaeyamensis]NMF35070.1 replicative DNA helicase [Flammeovirga yaeyamensis]